MPDVFDRDLTLPAVRVTEAAAIAAFREVGRGDEKQADQAAVDAMRTALNALEIDGRIVIGEGGGLGHPDELEREVPVRPRGDARLTARCTLGRAHAGILNRYIRSGASTPTRSRQRAITVRVASHSASRNACSSEPSTRWWW